MSEKSAADVADKALDQVSGAIGAMADAAKKVAPHAWEVLVRQQVLDGWVTVGAWALCLVLGVAYTRWASKDWSEKSPKDYLPFGLSGRAFFRAVTSAVVWLCLFVGLMANVTDAVKQIANPEYYAIKDLLLVAK